MDVGVLCPFSPGRGSFERLRRFGVNSCQLLTWNPEHWTPALAEEARKDRERSGARISAVWAGWKGAAQWNFTQGPTTLGIVP